MYPLDPIHQKLLKQYGKRLVANLPGPTTELLKALCTGRYRPVPLDQEGSEQQYAADEGMRMDMPAEDR
jgi:hypothetical protein